MVPMAAAIILQLVGTVSAVPTSPPVERQFIEETIYRYTEAVYTPAVRVAPAPAVSPSRNTPEGAVAALFAAVYAGDVDRWLTFWPADERVGMVRPDIPVGVAHGGKTHAERRARWRDQFQGREVYITARADTPDFVLLDYEVRAPQENAPEKAGSSRVFFLDRLLLVRQKDGWGLTNRYADNLLFLFWRKGVPRISREYNWRATPGTY